MTEMRKALLIVAALSLCIALDAQTAAILNIHSDPASAAMGGAGVALSTDAYAIENNIAAAALSPSRLAVAAGYGMWQPKGTDSKILSAQGFYRLGGKLAVALQYRNAAYPEYTVVSSDGRVKGSFTPAEMTAGLGVAYRIADGLAAGVNLRMLSSSLADDAKATAFGADIALKYDKNALQAALAVCNIGTKLNYGSVSTSLPGCVKAGAAYSISGFTLGGEADVLFSGAFAAGAGAQYTIMDIVSLRAGYHFGKSYYVPASHVSLGAGVQWKGIKLDFAYLTASETLAGTMFFSLGYAF